MKRLLLVLMVLTSARVPLAQTPPEPEEPLYQPAQTISVTDITLPGPCIADGTVVLNALITKEGKPQEIEVRRDIECLTGLAVDAVKEWKFSPAMVKGKAVASKIAVAVTVCPGGVMGDPITMGTLKTQNESAIQLEFQPPEILHGKLPIYPTDAIVAGNVVLEISLSAKGQPADVKVLQDLPPFTSHALAALGSWSFMPATDNGNPIPSKLVLAFVFRPLFPSNE